MKLLLINTSPHTAGTTHHALARLATLLKERALDVHLFDTGAVSPCLGCGACKETGVCPLRDSTQTALSLASECRGYVFGAPVYYGGISGNTAAFMERFFRLGGGIHTGKYGSALTVARRAGGVAAHDRLLRYFPFGSLLTVSGTYWATLLARTPSDLEADDEGLLHLASLADAYARLAQ